MTRIRAAATTAVATLLLAGCNDSTDRPAADGSSASPTASGSPSAAPPAAPAEHTVMDPCALTPHESWERLVPDRQQDHVVLERGFLHQNGILINDDYVRYGCQVTYDNGVETPGIAWGYFPQSFSPKDLQRVLQGAGGTLVTAPLGFRAYTSGDFLSSDAIGLNGTTAIFVTAPEKRTSIFEGGRTPKKDLVAVLREMGRTMPLERQRKVDLPDTCPSAADVRAAYGAVEFARGGTDGDGRWWCYYREPGDGSELALTGLHLTDEAFNGFYASTRRNPHHVDMFDGPPGAIRMISLGRDGSVDSIVLDPDSSLYVDVKITVASPRHHADRAAVVDLAKGWADTLAG